MLLFGRYFMYGDIPIHEVPTCCSPINFMSSKKEVLAQQYVPLIARYGPKTLPRQKTQARARVPIPEKLEREKKCGHHEFD